MIKFLIKQIYNFENKSIMLDGYFTGEYYDHPIVSVNNYKVYLINDKNEIISEVKSLKFVHIQNNSQKSPLPNYAYNISQLDQEHIPQENWALLFHLK